MDVKITDNSDKFLSALESQIKSALSEIADKAVESAKANCPVDTGNLRDSITYKQENGTLTVGTDVEYGKYVEYGSIHNPVASHFLLNAMQNNTDSYKQIIENSLKN